MGASFSAAARDGGIVVADNLGCSPCCGTEAVVAKEREETTMTEQEVYRKCIKMEDGPASVDNVPYVPVPCGLGACCTYYMPFLPQTVLPPSVWEPLKRECLERGVGERMLQRFFLELCDPGDPSWGTVRLVPLFHSLHPTARRTARRLFHAEAGLRARRMRFEHAARTILDINALDFAGLVTACARALHRYHSLDIVTVRAIVRYAADDDVDALSKMVLRRAYLPEKTHKHTSAALVHFALRYPSIVVPFLSMQGALQSRFPSTRFWQEFHHRRGTLLLPRPLTPSLARAMTARVLMLECVSQSATPFLFGSQKTAVREEGGVLVAAPGEEPSLPFLEPPKYDLAAALAQGTFAAGVVAQTPTSSSAAGSATGIDESATGLQIDEENGEEGNGVIVGIGSTAAAPQPSSSPSPSRSTPQASTTAPSAAAMTTERTTTTAGEFGGRTSRSMAESAALTGRSTGRTGTMALEELEQMATDRSVDVTLHGQATAIPMVPDFCKKHAPPHGELPKITSQQIAERVFMHVASGAGAVFDFSETPCLMCGRSVLQVRAENKARRKRRRRSSMDASAMGLQRARRSSGLSYARRGSKAGEGEDAGAGVGLLERRRSFRRKPSLRRSLSPVRALRRSLSPARGDLLLAPPAPLPHSTLTSPPNNNAQASEGKGEEKGDMGEKGERGEVAGAVMMEEDSSDDEDAFVEHVRRVRVVAKWKKSKRAMRREERAAKKRAEAARVAIQSMRKLDLTGTGGEGSVGKGILVGDGGTGRSHPTERHRVAFAPSASKEMKEDEESAVDTLPSGRSGVRSARSMGGMVEMAGHEQSARSGVEEEHLPIWTPAAEPEPPTHTSVVLSYRTEDQASHRRSEGASGGIHSTRSTSRPPSSHSHAPSGTRASTPSSTSSRRRRRHSVIGEDGKPFSKRFTEGNSGFCDDCDVYIHRVMVDLFGYKLSKTIHDATVIPPPKEREVALHDVVARTYKQPLEKVIPTSSGPIGARDRPQTFTFEDDIFIELFDDATESFFYTNIATGKSQWTRPAKYRPYNPKEAHELL